MEDILSEESEFLLETIEQIKIIMDPMRMKILEIFKSKEELCTKDIADRVGEEPNKMYHHIRELLKTGIIEEAKTVVKGHLIEKYYRKPYTSILFDPKLSESLRNVSAEESQSLFNTSLLNFVAHLQNDAFDYVKRSKLRIKAKEEDAKEMRAYYQTAGIVCSYDEMKQFTDEIDELHAKYQPKNHTGRHFYRVFHVGFRQLD